METTLYPKITFDSWNNARKKELLFYAKKNADILIDDQVIVSGIRGEPLARVSHNIAISSTKEEHLWLAVIEGPPVKMHRTWAIWWYAYILAFVACNLSAAALPPWIWYVVYGVFVPPELFGAVLKNRFGDTLSESIWAFAQHGIARKLFAALFGIVLAARLWTLFDITAAYAGVEDYPYALRMAWDILIGGVIAWLPLHFFFIGKKG